jgi:hypothetical protein
MMNPVLFQSLGPQSNFVAIAVFLQIGLILFLTGRRYLRMVSVAGVSLISAVFLESVALTIAPTWAWWFISAGVLGGAYLGYYLRPVGVGLLLAYFGYTMSANVVGFPFVQYVVAIDLFAYGLLLTDLAPTLVSSLFASSILLVSILWLGASGPASFVIASAMGGARVMATYLPSRLAIWMHPRQNLSATS